MNLPEYMYSHELTSLIVDNIYDGYNSYENLPTFYKSLLVSSCIGALGDDAYEAITEHEDLRIVLHHLKMFVKASGSECESDPERKRVKNSKQVYALDLAETMSKNAMEHFSESLSKRYEEIYESVNLNSDKFGEAA